MIRDITIGQYYPVDSLIHKLDPRTKLAITFLYLVSLFFANNKYMYLLAMVVLVIYIFLSKVPLKHMVKGLRGILIFIFASVVINMFFTKGDPFIDWGFIHISWQGFRTACYTMVRIVFLVLGASVITYTTTPTKLTDGLEKAFQWLKRFKVPVHEIAMMVCIALRFIPILVEELDKIMKAQQARCADFENGNVIKRLKSLFPVILPMFVSAIRRAKDLALAMEARCYQGGNGRTKMKPLKYMRADGMAYGLLFLYLAGMIALRIVFSTSLLEQLWIGA